MKSVFQLKTLLYFSFGLFFISAVPKKVSEPVVPVITTTLVSNPEEKSETESEKAFEKMADSIYQEVELDSAGLDKEVFELALKGYEKLDEQNKIQNEGVISIIDFSKPSTEERLFVIDIEKGELLFKTFVAHGRNSGLIYANKFSNSPRSHKSSLGFYVTSNTYVGQHGYSLKLKGLEKGFNDNAAMRNIVLHGSNYVNEKIIDKLGYLGRSFGCPAVPQELHKEIINVIKDGSCLFIYHQDNYYLNKSKILNS